MKLPSRFLIGFVLAAVLLSACSVSGRNALIGKWTPETVAQGQTPAIQEYTTGGKFRQEVNSGLFLEATYQFVDEGSYILIIPEGLGIATHVKFSVQGDKLILTPIDATTSQPGTPETLVRVK